MTATAATACECSLDAHLNIRICWNNSFKNTF